MRPTLALLALVTSAALSACGDTGLSAIDGARIWVFPEPGGTDRFKVRLEYVQGPVCVTLPRSTKGTVNGAEAGDFFPGGFPEGQFGNCQPPSFTFSPQSAGAPEVTIAFEDGGERVAGTFRSLGSPLSVTVTPPEDGHIRPGSTVELRWAPETDDIHGTEWGLASPSQAWSSVQIDPNAFQDGRLLYTIPSHLPPGPAFILVSGQRAPGLVSCEATHCDASYPLLGGAPPPFGVVRADFEIEAP